MSIEIESVELGFHRPFNSEVSQTLKIRNPNPSPVAFKVKTTAPKQYCVRPNSGRIEPGREVEVIVLLQAMKQDPPLDAKCRDKFLVQSVALTSETGSPNGGSTLLNVDDAEKSTIHEKKIRVTYLPQQESVPNAKPAQTPIKSNYDSDGTSLANNSTQRSPSPEAIFTPETRNNSKRQTFGTSETVETKSSPQTNLQPTSAISFEEMKERLSKAEEIIASFSQDEGLRQRKGLSKEISGESITKLEQSVQHGSQGVPLQIVAALCFISFLLAYLLF